MTEENELVEFMRREGLDRTAISILLAIKKRQIDRYRFGITRIAPPALQLLKVLRLLGPRERMRIIKQLINQPEGERK